MDPQRLAITVTNPDGTTRWGYDEDDQGAIPGDLSFGTSTPGGFKDATCTLLRGLTPRHDENLFSGLRVYGPGNRTAWEGRIAQLPRQSGPGQLTPGAVGHSAHLQDFEAFMEVYVDRSPGSWREAPLVRQAKHVLAGHSYGGVPVAVGDGLAWSPTGDQPLTEDDSTELFWIGPGPVRAAKFQYRGLRTGAWSDFEIPTLFSSDDLDLDTYTTNTPTLDDTTHSITFAAKRILALRALPTADVTPPAGYLQRYQYVAVYGNHGLTLHSTGADEPHGVLASDVVADVVSRAAPLLTFTTGTDGTIQPTTFVIPHLTFDAPTTAADVIARANAYHAWDWQVWEDRAFHYRPPGSGVEWRARIGDGASLSLEGDAGEQIINGVVVAYVDNGLQKYAGPVGSGLDVESASLQDDDTENPATLAGLSWAGGGKWPVLSMTVPTTDAGAVQVGAVWLAERNLATRRGQMVLTGMVRHPEEGMVPAWRVRAGDTVKLTDRPGDPPRRIIETSYRHGPRQTTLTLDSTAHKVEALIERLAVTTSLLS